MKKIIFLLLTAMSLFATQIQIAVAANVSYAIDALKKEFALQHKDIKVNVILGSSGKLTAQIKHQAPYQLFMSANMKYPNALYQEKIAITKPRIYAQGGLALLSVKPRDFSKGLEILKDSHIKKIALANPKTAPYGEATFEALKRSKLLKDLKSKFIYGESISQTISYTISAADIGFVAKSSLFSPHLKQFKKGINWISIDPKLYTPIDQGIVILKNAQNNPSVKAFYDFMLSKKAQKILQAYGYHTP